jgi:hypothetical protein
MSHAGKAFQIGSVIVPCSAALNLSQRVETIGGRSRLRFADGAGLDQILWEKLRVTISGDGWCPPGLATLPSGPLTLKCGLPRAVSSTSNAVTIPAARRTDAGYLPYAWAHTADGAVATSLSLAGNVATCTAVAGAIAYEVMYFPELSVLCDPISEDHSRAGASWELVAEEA